MYLKCWKRWLMIAFFPTLESKKAEFIYRTVCLEERSIGGKTTLKKENYFFLFISAY